METAADILSLLSLVFLVGGLGVSVVGALSVWRTWAPEGETFWPDYLRPGPWAGRVIKRAFGRIRPPRNETDAAEATSVSVEFGQVDAFVTKGFSETEDLTVLKREIQQRIAEVQGMVVKEAQLREQAEADLRRAWGAGDEALDTKIHGVAIDGLRAEVSAILLLIISAGLQLASLML